MNNFFTLQNARDFVKRFVETGSCNSDTIDSRINEACRRLMVKAEWPYTTKIMRVRCDNRCFPLPREVEKVIWARTCNDAAHVFNMSYEFMDAGPGDLRCWSGSGYKDLVDAGVFPTMFDVPSPETFADDAESCTDRTLGEGLQLLALSTEIEDTTLSVTVRGLNKLDMDINGAGTTTFVPGEALTIAQWTGGVEGTLDQGGAGWASLPLSAKYYRQITGISKPVTKGYVTLYAVNPTTHAMYLLAKIHPDDTIPMWRRYKVSGMECTDDCVNILALVKLKCITLTRADDILPIQNLDAIKSMVICIREENAANLAVAQQYEANAIRLLVEQKADHEVSGGTPVIVDSESLVWGAQINPGVIL